MLLSVLIAVYQHEPAVLLEQLHEQLAAYQGQVEVLVFDDSAIPLAYAWHESYSSKYPWLKIYHHTQNLGRSRARNRLLSLAQGQFVWMLDGDVTLPQGLLKDYVEHLQSAEGVYCSGIAVPESAPDNFRNYYSRKAEVKSAIERNKQPYRSFTAANFAMPRHFVTKVGFPEGHEGYGHEDTHFGLQLLEVPYPVKHFDLPVAHAADDSDAIFIAKTREATLNLAKLFVNDPLFKRHQRYLKLIRSWELARNIGLVFFVVPWVKRLENRLSSGKRSLFWLNIYKLGLFEKAYMVELAAKTRS